MELLIRAQDELGLSRPDLCRMLGLPSGRPQTIRDWEAGRRQMDDARVRLLQAYLAGYRPDDWPKGCPVKKINVGWRAFLGAVEVDAVSEVHGDWTAMDVDGNIHQVDRVIAPSGRVITKPEGDDDTDPDTVIARGANK